MDKRFWIIIGVIIAVFAGFLLFSGGEDDTAGPTAKATSHIKGKTDAKVTLVEYGDFQCPVCAQYYPIVEQVAETYKDHIRLQFAHLPLTQIHPNAYAAARATEAASNQGKFWEMYAILFQNQQTWANTPNATPTFEGYAVQLGLDAKKFKTDFASAEVNARIRADRAVFNKTGEKPETPTFFLDGKKIKPRSVEAFSKEIDAALKKKGVEPPKPATSTPTITTPAPQP